MPTTISAARVGLVVAGAMTALPFLGAWAVHRVPEGLLQMPPPLPAAATPPSFSWLAAAAVVAPFAAIAASWLAARRKHVPQTGDSAPEPDLARPWPWWGRLALAWTLGWWILAWTRLPWFAAGQLYTFFPLWLGFVVVANALAWRRAGTCMMLRSTGRWLGLFAGSAAFWWMFEWLNRFSGNWIYLGVRGLGPAAYAAHATLCFSTVLPAVAGVREWIDTHPRWRAGVARGPAWPWFTSRAFGVALMLGGAAALALMGAWPRLFYASLWAAPLALAVGEGIVSARPGWWRAIAAGDWRVPASWSAAGLVCGLFWELWNWRSLARWSYAVPFVDRWHVFAMPLLGYAGYLPFGMACQSVCERVSGSRRRPS